MYGKKGESRKPFNGEGVVDYEEFREAFMVEADKRGAGDHFRWNEVDIAEDGSVPEEAFPHERLCAPGGEEAFALVKKEEQLLVLDQMFAAKVAVIDRSFQGAKRTDKLGDAELELIEKKAAVENGFFKSVNDIRAACDLFDKKEKLFNDSRAQAVALLNQWLGPNPLNRIHSVLTTLGPKNAWKKLEDDFNSVSQTHIYLNSVMAKMSALKFSKSMGKVVDHMAYLDRLNGALVRRGNPIDDRQLLGHLVNAITRSTEAMKLYGDAMKHIFAGDLGREAAVNLLTRYETAKETTAELTGERQSTQGAQFVRTRDFAGTATTRKEKKGEKRKRDQGGESSVSGGARGAGGAKKKKLKCYRCGGEHRKADCKEEVYCKPCDSHTHSEDVCFKTHPELRPKPKEVNSECGELTRSDRETLCGDGSNCTPPTVAAASGQSAEKASDVDDEEVMTLHAGIEKELVRKLYIAPCEGCAEKICGLPVPSGELGDAMAAHSNHGKNHPGYWIIIVDSGATRHMLPQREMLCGRIKEAVQGRVVLGSKSYSLKIEGVGETSLKCLNRVLWVPNLSMGLLSVPQFDKEGYVTTLGNKKCTVRDRVTGEVVITATMRGNLYVVDPEYMDTLLGVEPEEEEDEIAMPSLEELTEAERASVRGSAQLKPTQVIAGQEGLDLMHRRLGHLSETKLKKGLKNRNWIGAQYTYEELKDQRLKFCPACYEGKMKAFPRQPVSEKEVEPGNKFGINYKGPFQVQSVDGYNGFYLVCDYGSDYLWVFLVKSKDSESTKRVLEEFYVKVKALTKGKPEVMQCDYDTVLKSAGITKWLTDHEIRLQMSAPYTHWQNGKIERNIGKVMDTARTLMADGRVPKKFWSWAVRCAVYLLNRHPISKSDKTPLQVASGSIPDISPLVPFWSIGVYHKTAEERQGAWDAKAVKVRMLGYSDEAKNSYYVYEIGTAKTIKVRHDCVWDEQLLVGEVSQDNHLDEPDFDDIAAIEDEMRGNSLLEEEEDEETANAKQEEEYWAQHGGQPYWGLFAKVQILTETEEWIEDMCAMAARVLEKKADAPPTDEPLVQPKSVEEAFNGPEGEQWKAAYATEVNNFELRKVFIKAAQTGHAMKTKLILRKTRRPDGSIKYKVRLVAKGFTQIKGVNYNETYAPTTSTAVVLVVLAIGVILKLDLSSFDVTAAFLEGKNDYPNFAWLPKDFGELGGQRVQVVGNFYGEKQGPKVWNDRLNEILVQGKFERCPAHPCLYLKKDESGIMFMCVHVDDGLVVTSNPAMKVEFKDHLLKEVREATFDDNVKRYIGIDVSVTQDERGRRVKLTHEQYISDNWSGFTKTPPTPMSASHNLRKAKAVISDRTMLPDTGKFRFACDRARPDILVATGEIATGGDKNPSKLHEVVAARTKHYLYSTRTLGVELGEGELEIFGYSDAAYITEGNCKSRLGGCIFLNRYSGAVRVFSKTDSQISTVSHSSTEAEIKAMDEWCRELLHIVDIVSFLIGRRYDKPIKLFVDNKSAIQLCTTLKQTHAVKHINVRITFIRELVQAGIIVIYHVGSEDNAADAATKPLPDGPFTKHRTTNMVGHGGKLPPYSTVV